MDSKTNFWYWRAEDGVDAPIDEITSKQHFHTKKEAMPHWDEFASANGFVEWD